MTRLRFLTAGELIGSATVRERVGSTTQDGSA